MKVLLPLLLLLLVPALFSTGCLGSRRNAETNAIAAELEEGFKERWVARRVGELMQSGAATDGLQARRLALQEFSERYEFVRGIERK